MQGDKGAFVLILASHDLVTGSSAPSSAIGNIRLCKNIINKASQRLSCLLKWNRDGSLHPQIQLGFHVLAQIINSPINSGLENRATKSSETLEPETNEQGLRVQGHSIPGEVNIEALRAKKIH